MYMRIEELKTRITEAVVQRNLREVLEEVSKDDMKHDILSSALECAVFLRYLEDVSLLIEYGANVEFLLYNNSIFKHLDFMAKTTGVRKGLLRATYMLLEHQLNKSEIEKNYISKEIDELEKVIQSSKYEFAFDLKTEINTDLLKKSVVNGATELVMFLIKSGVKTDKLIYNHVLYRALDCLGRNRDITVKILESYYLILKYGLRILEAD